LLNRRQSVRAALRLSATVALFTGAGAALAQPPIVQPGAPGQAPRTLTPQEAARTADAQITPADIRFMQDMIWHHQQAVEMGALVRSRTNNPEVVAYAQRIETSQADEIRFMQNWLRSRGQEAPDPAATAGGQHAGHGAMQHAHHMPGMATAAQMTELAAARGPAFDRLFLQRMIAHHEGALTMAQELLANPASAREPTLFDFANEVVTDQRAEITRMTASLNKLVDDPRTGLAAGFRDAGQAARNVRLIASLPKPTGFFDPAHPSGMILSAAALPSAGGPDAQSAGGAQITAPAAAGQQPPQRTPDNRPPGFNFNFANTDMAFSGDLLAAGNYHGFNLYRLSAEGQPRLLSSVICPGGQGDLSIVGNLIIMSVEQNRGRVDCGTQGVSGQASPERFRGLRIFDISNPERPRQVGQVQTCRGSHTHSIVSGPGADGMIIVYNSGTSGVRSEEELAGCVGEVPGDSRTALFRIDVIEIPVADPSRARIVDSPAVFADPATGRLAGLWQGGDHGAGTQETDRTDQCHDITVFPSRNLAAGACSGNGIIFDITDPRRPRRIDVVSDPNFAYWHSATFNNDGTKVLFTDEWGGGGAPRCRAQDPLTWGANAIYDIVGGRLQFRDHWKLPAAQSEQENCVAHNGSIVPVPGRDIFAQAWYQGGLSVTDFTDSANPVEIAFFDRGPVHAEHMVGAGYWSTYWYNGRIYGTEIARGLDVLALQPSDQLSANELAAAALATHEGRRFNPQQQFPVSWPDHPVVAMAYVDQLQRTRALAPATLSQLTQALGQARPLVEGNRKDARLASRLEMLAGSVRATGADAASARRAAALQAQLRGIARRLR
jgi:uncharacterized protein (DUF305 family)